MQRRRTVARTAGLAVGSAARCGGLHALPTCARTL